MNYESVEEYLNEEFRKPIKHYLKGVSQKKQKQVMEVVDYLCDKYREANGTALFYEDQYPQQMPYKQRMFQEWREFMHKNGYLEPVNYDELDDVISEDEMEVMMGEDE